MNGENITTDTDIISLPIKIKSGNVLARKHWAERRRLKQEYKLLIRNQMRRKKVPFCEDKKYKLVILSYRKKLLDIDNLWSGLKQLLDALIEENFIYDDSPDYVDIKLDQYTAKEYQTIIIRK